MNIISRIKNVLSNTEKSKKGVTCTRRLCVGDIDEQYIWFEVCDKNKEDYQCQYPVPIKDIRYNKEQINELEKLDIDDKDIYKVKMKSINKRGTAWIFVSKSKIDELPVGYQKNQFTP